MAIVPFRDQAASGSLSPLEPGQAEPDDKRTEHLSNVGFVVWQSAFVLLEYLLRHPPFGQWHDVHVLELGCGTGIGGIALALAGANVTLTDLPHVLHLTRRNVAVNCQPPQHRTQVREYAWGSQLHELQMQPDVIIGADVVYQQEHFDALITSLWDLCAAHTVAFISYRLRGRGELIFRRKLDTKGFAVIELPKMHLHEEYQDGQYVILRICKL